jgi:hypothetical protein
MTRGLDLLRADVDLVAMIVRQRGALASSDVRTSDDTDGDEKREEGA